MDFIWKINIQKDHCLRIHERIITVQQLWREMQQIIATNTKHLTNTKDAFILLNDCDFIEK